MTSPLTQLNDRAIWLLLLLLVSSFSTHAESNQATSEEPTKPNILWIITDDQRADSVESFNLATTGKRESPLGEVMSPNIDELASEGVLFTHAFNNSPMCNPSRASMQSGRYPFRTGHYKFMSHQKADFVRPTTSQVLSDEGYGTAVFGKTHWGIRHEKGDEGLYDFVVEFGRDLAREGFGEIYNTGFEAEFPDGIFRLLHKEESITYPNGKTESYIAERSDNNIPKRDQKIKQAVEEKYDILRSYTRLHRSLILGGENPMPAGKTVDGYIVKEFKSYLENQDRPYKTLAGRDTKGADSNKPLMVNLSFNLPHTPVLPPKKYRDIFKTKSYKIPEFDTDQLSNFPPQLVTLYNECKADQLQPEEKLQAIQDYYAFCAYGDDLIGESVQAFKEYNEKNNQEYLIIYTVGDHGWHLGEQGIMAKFGPWRQSLHNAAIVVSSDKEKFPPGTINSDIVEFVDFAPTMLAAANVDISGSDYDHLDGYDLANVVSGEALKREYAIGEVNVVHGHRAYMRTKDFAFSMRTRDKWDESHAPNLNDDITWALTCDRPKADMALYDLRNDPDEKLNVADAKKYRELADWFRNKLGNIVLGDGRVEADWSKPNSYNISSFAAGSDDKKLDIPQSLIPSVSGS